MSARTFGVVLTFRAPEKLAACLASLRGQCDTIFTQDNSDDETRLYTRGVNIGIRAAQDSAAEYVLICCDDVIVHPGCVARLAQFLDDNPIVAIAAPVQVGTSGDITCAGCHNAFPVGRYLLKTISQEPYEVPWANGACFLLRLSAVREVGLLDEAMHFICSDSDYSLTLRSRGWFIFVVPDAIVQHEPGGAKTPSPYLQRVMQDDMAHFWAKWMTAGLFGRLTPEGQQLGPLIQRQYEELNSWIAKNPPK